MKVIGVHAIALAEEAKEVMASLHRCREDFDVVEMNEPFAYGLTEYRKLQAYFS